MASNPTIGGGTTKTSIDKLYNYLTSVRKKKDKYEFVTFSPASSNHYNVTDSSLCRGRYHILGPDLQMTKIASNVTADQCVVMAGVKQLKLPKTGARDVDITFTPGIYYTVYDGYFNDDVNFFKIANKDRRNPGVPNEGIVKSFIKNDSGQGEISSATNNYITGNPRLYTVLWNAIFVPYMSGNWKFYIVSDDAAYLWVNVDINNITTQNARANNVNGRTFYGIDNKGLHPGKYVESGSTYFHKNEKVPIIICHGNKYGYCVFRFVIIDPMGNQIYPNYCISLVNGQKIVLPQDYSGEPDKIVVPYKYNNEELTCNVLFAAVEKYTTIDPKVYFSLVSNDYNNPTNTKFDCYITDNTTLYKESQLKNYMNSPLKTIDINSINTGTAELIYGTHPTTHDHNVIGLRSNDSFFNGINSNSYLPTTLNNPIVYFGKPRYPLSVNVIINNFDLYYFDNRGGVVKIIDSSNAIVDDNFLQGGYSSLYNKDSTLNEIHLMDIIKDMANLNPPFTSIEDSDFKNELSLYDITGFNSNLRDYCRVTSDGNFMLIVDSARLRVVYRLKTCDTKDTPSKAVTESTTSSTDTTSSMETNSYKYTANNSDEYYLYNVNPVFQGGDDNNILSTYFINKVDNTITHVPNDVIQYYETDSVFTDGYVGFFPEVPITTDEVTTVTNRKDCESKCAQDPSCNYYYVALSETSALTDVNQQNEHNQYCIRDTAEKHPHFGTLDGNYGIDYSALYLKNRKMKTYPNHYKFFKDAPQNFNKNASDYTNKYKTKDKTVNNLGDLIDLYNEALCMVDSLLRGDKSTCNIDGINYGDTYSKNNTLAMLLENIRKKERNLETFTNRLHHENDENDANDKYVKMTMTNYHTLNTEDSLFIVGAITAAVLFISCVYMMKR